MKPDGRLDVMVAGRTTAAGSNDAWGRLDLGAGTTPVSEGSQLKGFPSLGERLALMQINSSIPTTLRDGRRLDLGGLSLMGVELKAPGLEPEGSLCFANDFVGPVTTLTGGSYVPGNSP